MFLKFFRQAMETYGIWDQIRVDHGREFYLMLFIQNYLKDLRYDQTRTPFVQSTSRMVSLNFECAGYICFKYFTYFKNRVIERIWHEVNQRVNYRIKKWLVELVQRGLIDMDLQIDKVSVGHCVRSLVSIGLNRFQQSWNHHRIPGNIGSFLKDSHI